MAALGSKRKRFLGVGDDRMEVTSLIRSLVELPLGADGARVHPSPGAAHGSRLALQTCAGGADPRPGAAEPLLPHLRLLIFAGCRGFTELPFSFRP